MALKSELIGPDFRVDRAWAALGSAIRMLGAEAALIFMIAAWVLFDAGSAFIFSWVSVSAVLLFTLGAVSFVWGGLYWIWMLEWDRFVHRSKLTQDGKTRVLLSAFVLVLGALALPVLGFVVWRFAFQIAHPEPFELS